MFVLVILPFTIYIDGKCQYLIGVRSKLLYYILFADSKLMRTHNEDFNWRLLLK